MKTNTLLRVDGSREALPDGELTLDQMYKAIECTTVELVQLSESAELWCDEEGLLRSDWKPNLEATALYRKAHPSIPPEELAIVGNAILTTTN
jgi:hypothetical protein